MRTRAWQWPQAWQRSRHASARRRASVCSRKQYGSRGDLLRRHAGSDSAGTQERARRDVPAVRPEANVPRGARRLPTGHFSATEVPPSAPAVASAAAAGSPQVNVNGVSSLDSQVTNYNLKFEPPDQGLCKGNGFVLEVVNSAYRIYNTAGKSVRGPFNINDLFNVGGKEFTSDPRCWFDSASQTWFATVIFLNDTFTASALLVAVRHSPNPLGLWNEYAINTNDVGNGCPCFADQSRIGMDQHNLYVTDDEFRSAGRVSWAQKCGRSTSPSWSPAPRGCTSFASLT
jgi:hypothetical protein